MTAPQRPPISELETIRDLAMAANAALYSRREIEDSQRRAAETNGEDKPLIPESWRFVDEPKLAVRDHNDSTGLHAYAFRKSEREIVIAYRSADDPHDHDLKKALQSDGKLLEDVVGMADPLGIGPQGDTPRQLKGVQQWAWGDYHPQMADALRYYEDVQRAYPNADITLTGFREGGALAAMVGNATRTRTEAFDPPGARNAETSPEWRAELAQRSLPIPGEKGPGFIEGLHTLPASTVTSWVLNHGDAARFGGEPTGAVQPLSGRAGREGVADWVNYSADITAKGLQEAPLLELAGKRVKAIGMVADAASGAAREAIISNVAEVPRDDREVMKRVVRAFDEGVRELQYPGWRGENEERNRATPDATPRAPQYAGPSGAPAAPGVEPVAVADPKLLETLRGHCRTLGAEHGWTQDNVDRAASALYAQCRQEYVDRIDGVVFGIKGAKVEAGDNLFAYGKQASGFDDRVYVGTVAAMATPTENSLARAQTLDVQRAQEQQLELQLAQQKAQGGPNLTM